MKLGIVYVVLAALVSLGKGAEERPFKACYGDNSDINVLLGIPRRGINLQKVSADLGSYDPVIVPCDGGTNICQAPWLEDFSDSGLELIYDRDYASANPGSWVNYLQSLIVYFGVGIAFAVIAVLATIVACCCRICCCKRPVLYEDEDGNLEKPYEYPVWQTVLTYACLVIFLVLIFTFTLLAQIRGNKGFTTAQLALVDAPDNLATLAQGLADPVVTVASSLIGRTAVNLVSRLNQSLVEDGQLILVHYAFGCAREVFDYITDPALIEGFLSNLDDIRLSISVTPQVDVDPIINDVQADLSALNNSLGATKALLVDLNNALSSIDLDALENSVGQVTTLKNTLQTKVATASVDLANYTTFLTNVGLLQVESLELGGGTVSYTVTRINDYITLYGTVKTSYSALKTPSQLSASLISMNDTMNDLEAQLILLKADLENADTAVAGAPGVLAINASLNQVLIDLDEIDVDALKVELSNATSFLVELPSLQPILDRITDINNLKDKMPCIFSAIDVPQNINDNLVQLPGEVLNVTSQISEFNATLNNATAQLDTILVEIDRFKTSFDSTVKNQTTGFTDSLDSIKAQLSNTRNDIVLLQGNLANFNANVLDVSSALTSVTSVLTDLQDPSTRPSSSIITSLDGPASTAFTGLGTYYSTDAAFVDKLDALSGSPPDDQTCVGTSTICYQLSPPAMLPPSCDCDYPSQEWNALSGVTSDLLSAMPDFTGLSSELTALSGELDGVQLDCCNDFSQTKALQTDAASSTTSIDSATSELTTVSESLDTFATNFNQSAVDSSEFNATFADLRANILDFNSSLFDGQDFDMIRDVFEKERGLFKLLLEDLGGILDEIREPRLIELLNGEAGFEGTALHVLEQVDKMIAYVDPASATLVNQTSEMFAIIRGVDTARDTDNSLREKGSAYYLERIVATLSNQTGDASFKDASAFEQYETPGVNGYIVDGELVEYPDDSMCITDACLKNSIEFYNNEPISSIAPDELNSMVAIPLSRTQAMALPFIIPGLLMIMTLLVFFFPKCGYWVAGCSACVMPFIFVIVGGAIFPFVILTADVCASAENVGIKAIESVAPYICTSALNGTLTPEGYCAYNVSVPPLVKQVEIDPEELVQSFLQDCSGESGANLPDGEKGEPVGSFIASIGLEASLIVANQIAKMLDEDLPDLGVVLGPVLRADFESSSDDLEDDVIKLSNSLNSAVGCKKVYDAYAGFKEAFCCEFSQAVYWSFAGWYLMAFCMLFCGLPVGCFAATRLRNIKESREHLRIFYSELASSNVGRRVGEGFTYARSAIGNLGNSSRQVVVADVVDDDAERGHSRGEAMRQRMKGLGTSFKKGSENVRSKMQGAMGRFRKKGKGGDDGPDESMSAVSPAVKPDTDY